MLPQAAVASSSAFQFAVAVIFALARAATGQPVVPVGVAFAQPPPRT
jgi:hypothetical protein